MPYHLYAFGSNGEGQLGLAAEEIVSIPTRVSTWPQDVGNLQSIHGGDNHTLFLTTSGEVYVAGDNQKSQLGGSMPGPCKLEFISGPHSADISACAATCVSSAYISNEIFGAGDGSAQTMLSVDGTSHWGELGSDLKSTNGVERNQLLQPLPKPVINFAGGGWHYVAILSDGSIYGWGKSRLDQLGEKLSPQQRISKPTCIEEDIPFAPAKVVCGKDFTYLASLPSLGQHYLLGRDKFNLRSSMPPHITNWKDIGATWHSIFVLFEDGSLTAWGKDNMWKLVPDDLPPLDKIAVGSEHVLALTREGKLISWGWGKHGNCGDLTALGSRVRNDMVSGIWNEIRVPGAIKFIGAGFCTSFVLTEVTVEEEASEEALPEK